MIAKVLDTNPELKYRGVFLAPKRQYWRAVLEYQDSVYDLGQYHNFVDAVTAYMSELDRLKSHSESMPDMY